MKIKPLIQLKLLGLFLFSCTIDANLNEDYKNKVKGILNKAADDQETTSADTNSNAAKNIPTADKVAAELKKQSQAAKTVAAAPNKGSQNQPQTTPNKGSQNQQAAPRPQLQSLSFSADLSNLPKTTAARAASPTKQRIPIQAVTTVPGNTRTFNSRNSGLPTFALNYSFSQPTRQQTNSSFAVQTTTSSGSKLQTLKNELIRAISEEKIKHKTTLDLEKLTINSKWKILHLNC